jgi:PAS domain S-box-containing protein
MMPQTRAERAKPPKWRYIYFLLAAFDLVTVSAGLYLNHRIMGIYLHSVEVNRVWADRIGAYSHLGELAEAVDAPGNDVFDTHDVRRESARMIAAGQAFDLDLLTQRQEMEANIDPTEAAPLLEMLDAIAVAKTQMTEEAARIFDHFLNGRPDSAGERMATMDHKYASLNAALLQLRRAVSTIQQQNFTRQTAAAAELQRYEYGIGLSIILMVAGATFYGHKIAQQMQADADERERHFDALRKAEARTRSILDTAAEGIASFDEQWKIESFNTAAEHLFGLDPGEAVGRDIRSFIPGMAECVALPAAVPGGSPALSLMMGGERVGRRRDGTVFPLELSVSHVDFGRVRTSTAIVRDVSDRRRAEEALGVAAAAQAANRAKSQFLANMSHEIRTPMSGVLGMAEMLLDTPLTATQRRYAERVHSSGESLLKIIDGILDFSKIEAGKVDLESVEFKPRELAEEVTQLLRDGAQRKGLSIVCRVADDVPGTLRGAPSRVRQVLTNLVGNAIKFTDRGGAEIRVSRLDRAVDNGTGMIGEGAASDRAAGTVLHFSVQDTGIGIAESVQHRLFHAFEQADSSTTRSYGGTGLGLAISRELVEKMGGRIGVRSKPGEGAEFWFTLGFAPALPPGLRPALDTGDRNHAVGLNGVHVLLAEDNPVSQDVSVAMLESFGCHVHVVETGARALAALSDASFDIVLMDRQMPEMDGFHATAEIRARRLMRPMQPAGSPSPVRLPVVGLTASALKGDRELCIAAGMDDYLAKPFRREALRTVLERWVLDRTAGEVQREMPQESAQRETFDRATLVHLCSNQPLKAPKILESLIDQYLADARQLVATLERAADDFDASAVAHTAHLLRSGSEFIGAHKLADMCGELEEAGLTGEMGGAGQRVLRIRQEYDAVRQAIDELGHAGDSGTPVNTLAR